MVCRPFGSSSEDTIRMLYFPSLIIAPTPSVSLVSYFSLLVFSWKLLDFHSITCFFFMTSCWRWSCEKGDFAIIMLCNWIFAKDSHSFLAILVRMTLSKLKSSRNLLIFMYCSFGMIMNNAGTTWCRDRGDAWDPRSNFQFWRFEARSKVNLIEHVI